MSVLQSIRFAVAASRLGTTPFRSPDRVARLQRRRLRRLVQFAARHSPFYRDKFRGIDLASADLASLPVTRKQELAENFERVVTDRASNATMSSAISPRRENSVAGFSDDMA